MDASCWPCGDEEPDGGHDEPDEKQLKAAVASESSPAKFSPLRAAESWSFPARSSPFGPLEPDATLSTWSDALVSPETDLVAPPQALASPWGTDSGSLRCPAEEEEEECASMDKLRENVRQRGRFIFLSDDPPPAGAAPGLPVAADFGGRFCCRPLLSLSPETASRSTQSPGAPRDACSDDAAEIAASAPERLCVRRAYPAGGKERTTVENHHGVTVSG